MSSSLSTPDSFSDLNSDPILEELHNLQLGFRQPEANDLTLACLLQFMKIQEERRREEEQRRCEEVHRILQEEQRILQEEQRILQEERQAWMERLLSQREPALAPNPNLNQNLDRIPSIRLHKLSGKENQEAINKFCQLVQSEAECRSFNAVETIKFAQYNLTGNLGKWNGENSMTEWDSFEDFQKALSLECLKRADNQPLIFRFLSLQQGPNLPKYILEFEELKDRVPGFYTDPTFLLHNFLRGLQEPLRTRIRLQNCETWQAARDLTIAEDAKTAN